jgi:putative ATP-dependent endonuclease of OLD family
MAIKKIKINNFKIFENYEVELTSGLNILVGDNEVGKSTILEAIHLVLTGMINGRYLNTELTQYLFNNNAVSKYIESIAKGSPLPPPRIVIELFLDENEDYALYMGSINSDRDNKAYGVTLVIELTPTEEYAELLRIGDISSLPIEYYDATWRTFADASILTKSIPIKSAMIDSSLTRFQNGSDMYISRIVRQSLEKEDAVKIAQAHRKMLDGFTSNVAVSEIATKIQGSAAITDRKISLAVEAVSKNAWEGSFVTCVDDVPFHYIGKGEQCVIKTRLALSDKKAQKASVIMIEEPENHLTHARLNQLLNTIATDCKTRQVIVSTHSSFVANKLGLEHIALLSKSISCPTRFMDLTESTSAFFKKLHGYDTLRLVLSKSSILVEGASDELVVQKAYMNANNNVLPIENGIDTISVGTAFLRFLEIAVKLNKRTAVVTDNDGKIEALKEKYADYLDNKHSNISIFFDGEDHTPEDRTMPKDYNYNTLEPLMLLANGRTVLNEALKTNETVNNDFQSDDALLKFMKTNKTETALAVFEYKGDIQFPPYITEAIKYVAQ